MASEQLAFEAITVQMFGHQPIASWNVSRVQFMEDMFKGAARFNQNLFDWPVGKVERSHQFEKPPAMDPGFMPTWSPAHSHIVY